MAYSHEGLPSVMHHVQPFIPWECMHVSPNVRGVVLEACVDFATDNTLDALANMGTSWSKHADGALRLFRTRLTARNASLIYGVFARAASADHAARGTKSAWRDFICKCIFRENGCISKGGVEVALQSSFEDYLAEDKDLKSQMMTNTYSETN